MMLQEKLKENTKQYHDMLEQLMFVEEIMQKSLTKQQYHQILVINYIVHKNYETAVHESIGAHIPTSELEKRKKLSLLELDLEEVGIKKESIDNKLLNFTTEIPNDAFAMGCMYVLEGATLGGNVIQKQLANNPNFSSEMGMNYYRCYGPQLMENWKTFVGVLNSLREEHHMDAVNGATWMFSELTRLARRVNGHAY